VNINPILIAGVTVALSLSVFLGIFALFYGKSEKKNYFVLTMLATSLFLLGHMLELLSGSRDEAFTALKVLYIGSPLVSTLTPFFIADYCDVKLHKFFVKIPMLLFSLTVTLSMWTTQYHRLIYTDYWFDSAANHYLQFTPGPLYYVFHMYPIVCLGICSAIILSSLKKRKKTVEKKSLIVLLLTVMIPFISEALYFISIAQNWSSGHDIYFTPHSLALMGLVLFAGVLRFHMFDVIPEAATIILDTIAEAYVLIDADENFLAANPAAERLFPGLASIGKGSDIRNVTHWPKELRLTDDTAKGSYFVDYSSRHLALDQEEIRYYRASVNPVKSNNKRSLAYAILIQDVTDSVKMISKLEIAAFTDPLTGLYNRRYFAETARVYIEKASRQNEPYFVMMLDLDRFKDVNDTFGHQTGDKVLKRVASVVKHIIRPYDLLARYGGEEFVLLAMEVDDQVAWQLAERIRGAIENMDSDYPESNIGKTTCSIGIAKSSANESVEDMIGKADKALYMAKKAGRNRVYSFASETRVQCG
jgi:diguanylate cyclase (GGDEF)-like protein